MRTLGVAGSMLAVITLSTSLTSPAAQAADEQPLKCTAPAQVFTVQPNGDLWLFEHSKPDTGDFAWGNGRRIGTDWAHGRTLVGWAGFVYSITGTGDFRRFWWKDGQWQGGGTYSVIGRGWGIYATDTAYAKRITVDQRNHVYSINQSGELVWSSQPDGSQLKSVVIAKDWGKYTSIVASGEGVIYARDAQGEVWRYRFHADSGRFYEARTPVTGNGGWNNYKGLSGAGGGVIYGVNSATGDLEWRRDASVNNDADVSNWKQTRVIGHGWGNDVDTVVVPDTCRREPDHGPSRPVVSAETGTPSALVNADGKLKIAYSTSDKGLRVLTEDSENSWSSKVVGDFHMLDVTAQPGPQGALNVAAEYYDGVKTFTVGADGQMSAPVELGGYSTAMPVVTVNGNAYFMDGQGALWYRYAGKPWQRKLGYDTYGGLRGITRPDGVVVLVAVKKDTLDTVVITDDHGQISGGQVIEGYALEPALSLDSDGTVRVTVKDVVERNVKTRRLGASSWTVLPDVEPAYYGQVSGAVQDGKVDLVMRGNAGKIVVSSQTQVNGSEFGPWVEVGNGDASTPSIVRNQNGQLVLTYRDSSNNVFVYKKTPEGYVGGKIG
ncbi:tachylectin-related carbohydrate-binding protein [Lentzea sp. NBRC 105346]|uniref:tachylectin-related carbohydrate-binding protein n=1 Tax=Lentzea sp. NBRC 105346 TaxID=3032205 RepID=UPI0025558474|nr:tachylectin-related carbohydrate-binding protein [Lentzea sp. NBRC 105346]